MQTIIKLLSKTLGFSKLYKKILVPIGMVVLLSALVYYFHYLPMGIKDKAISSQAEKIDALELKVSNLNALLLKKEDDLKKESFDKKQTIENMNLIDKIEEIEEFLYDEINSSIGIHDITI